MRQDLQRQEALQSLRQQELRLQMERESQRQHELLRIGRTYTPPLQGYGVVPPPPPPPPLPQQQQQQQQQQQGQHEQMGKRRYEDLR